MSQRLLFLIPAGRFIPSGVRRVLGYLPLLRRDGFRCTVLSYQNELTQRALLLWKVPEMLRVPGLAWRAKVGLEAWDERHTRVTLDRILDLAPRHDAVVIQWIYPPAAWTARLLQANPRVIYDFDDAVFLDGGEPVDFLLKNAQVVATGSHFNLEYAQRICRRAVFLPTPVPRADSRAVQRPSNGARFEIGWLGSLSTLPQLELLHEPLRELAARHPDRVRLTIIGCGKASAPFPTVPGLDLRVIPWLSERQFCRYLPALDAGLYPLRDRDKERGKCGAKALWYMTYGVPAVCSPVGENSHIVQHGINGLLAGTSPEWVAALETLMADPAQRDRIARQARETVAAKYAVDVCYQILRDQVLSPVLARHAHHGDTEIRSETTTG